MRVALFSALALLAGLIAYGSLIEPRLLLDEPHHEVELAHLPPGWDGARVALFADLQVGMWFDNPGMVRRAVAQAVDAAPELVLIAGDFVYKPDSSTVREAVDLVRPLAEAGIPTLVVFGNHDYSLMKKHSEERPPFAEYLEALLVDAGVQVLSNESSVVRAGNGDSLWVSGVGSVWAEDADVEAAQASVPADAARLWLMHNPEAFRRIPPGEAPLALAAHTHGGQIRILGPRSSWLDIVREGETVADGWAADSIGAPGNRLYVNRGLGFSGVPIRFRCRPELTVFTLRRSADD